LIAIETIIKTSVVKIIIIRKRIKRSSNLEKIKTSLSSIEIRTKTTITKSKKLLKQ